MGVSFKIKVKSASGFTTSKVTKDGKSISQLIATSIKNDISGIAGTAIVETIRQHNERVLIQAAIFFQRVVTRTPKDESYYDPVTQKYHKADNDFVWKNWTVLYWGKSISAEDMGEELFESDQDFNSKEKIQTIANIIKNSLFGGEEKFNKRKTRIRSLRFENKHPRFAMLEYGGYDKSDSNVKTGKKYEHGIVNHYSVQAPYGMLRITQAEMESMSIADFDKYWKRFSSNSKKEGIKKVPSANKLKELYKIIEKKNHLSGDDIDKIGEKM